MTIMRKLLVLTLAFAALLPVADAAACVKSRTVPIETGPSPSGESWAVKAKRAATGKVRSVAVSSSI
jgi:hypothetical protein